MIERFLVRFEDGGESYYHNRDNAVEAANHHDEIIHLTDYCPEVYRYTKLISILTNNIGDLMTEVDDLRVILGSEKKYGAVETGDKK